VYRGCELRMNDDFGAEAAITPTNQPPLPVHVDSALPSSLTAVVNLFGDLHADVVNTPIDVWGLAADTGVKAAQSALAAIDVLRHGISHQTWGSNNVLLFSGYSCIHGSPAVTDRPRAVFICQLIPASCSRLPLYLLTNEYVFDHASRSCAIQKSRLCFIKRHSRRDLTQQPSQ
jgi:hypothetical protein